MNLLQPTQFAHGSSALPAIRRPAPPRQRARVACNLCHERKVRCDVSVVGSPCTNCRLDSHTCSTRPLTRRHKKRIDSQRAASPAAPFMPESLLSVPDSNPWEGLLTNGEEISLPASPSGSLGLDDNVFGLFHNHSVGPSKDQDHTSLFSSQPPPLPPMMGTFRPFSLSQDLTFNTSVTFSYYRFLKLKELTRLLPEDVRYLETKGCLHVPSGAHLDQFVRHYFLHVHPCMPILDEGEFWEMYSSKRDDDKRAGGISLLVFQAMLFAASTFVPPAVLKACGFQNFYTAREILHQRARLLFNFRTETNPFAIAQASLLLSFQCTPHDLQVNTSWLSTAIQYARAGESHLYYCLSGLSGRQRRERKRLWWCCVLRDRIIALGVRRHIQITPDHFDFGQTSMTEQDFAGELEQSQVYDPETKTLLVRTFILQCQLAVALTSTLMTIYPLNGVMIPAVSNLSRFSKLYGQIDESKRPLSRWMEKAKTQLDPNPEKVAALHNSVTLYTDLTFIYYFSAQIALCHYTMYFLTEYRALSTNYVEQLKATRAELELATVNVTRKVKSLVSLGLVGHLPISVLAYTALPLVLLALDVKLSSTESQKLKRKHRLSLYVEMMKHYGHRYDFVNVVSDTIGKLLQLVDLRPYSVYLPTQGNSSDTNPRMLEASRPRTWGDIVIRQPKLYFRLSVSLDYTLSTGKYPSDNELPTWIVNSYPPTVPSESVALEEITNHVAATAQDSSPTTNMSLLRNEPLNMSQCYGLDEAISLPSNGISDPDCNGSALLEHDVFGLGGSIGIDFGCGGFDNDFERNEGNDANQFLFGMLSNISDSM